MAFTHPGGQETVDPGDTNTVSDVYVRNVDATTTTLASRKDGFGGTVGNAESNSPAIAGNGTAVAFVSSASNLEHRHDGDSQPDVYRRALAVGTTNHVNVNFERRQERRRPRRRRSTTAAWWWASSRAP